MKIYIHTDLEGISCLTDYEMELDTNTGRGISYLKEILTLEVNAAIDGILKAVGDNENVKIVVQDGHGGGYWGSNLLSEKINPNANVILGRRSFELTAIDESFDALFIIGAHSMEGTPQGNLNHTIAHGKFYNYYINGIKIGEAGLCAAIAGYYDVPLALVTGDFWATKEITDLIKNSWLKTVATKKGINRYTAECYPLSKNLKQISEAAYEATFNILSQNNYPQPLKTGEPIKIKVDYVFSDQADSAEKNYYAKRIDDRTVEFSGADLLTLITASYT